MERVPEPELMLDWDQALAYANADFSEPHQMIIDLMLQKLPDLPQTGIAIDLGCGPGDMLIRLANALVLWEIDALDGSPAMIELAKIQISKLKQLNQRINLYSCLLQEFKPPRRPYTLIFSNSLLHHLKDPSILWTFVVNHTTKGSWIYVADLRRPQNFQDLERLVELYASNESEILRRDFRNSLAASFTVEEVRSQLNAHGLHTIKVEMVGDRHLIAYGKIS